MASTVFGQMQAVQAWLPVLMAWSVMTVDGVAPLSIQRCAFRLTAHLAESPMGSRLLVWQCEEAPVINVISDALAVSCAGRIDVIGHSMDATLAAKQIADYQLQSRVDAFIGIAGAF